jgi:transcriptional regulator with XRE-family HTH domain
MSTQPESALRIWRKEAGYSLDYVCDLLEQHGLERPSAAKLSRIERDQDIPPEMIPAFTAISGIPAKDQRPDLAKIFSESEAAS